MVERKCPMCSRPAPDIHTHKCPDDVFQGAPVERMYRPTGQVIHVEMPPREAPATPGPTLADPSKPSKL